MTEKGEYVTALSSWGLSFLRNQPIGSGPHIAKLFSGNTVRYFNCTNVEYEEMLEISRLLDNVNEKEIDNILNISKIPKIFGDEYYEKRSKETGFPSDSFGISGIVLRSYLREKFDKESKKKEIIKEIFQINENIDKMEELIKMEKKALNSCVERLNGF